MYSTEATIILSQNFVSDCIKNGIEIDKAILFGSMAKKPTKQKLKCRYYPDFKYVWQ
jgi:hypothetical protein